MIGLRAIGSYIPSRSIDNYQRTETFQTDEAFIRDKIGFERLSRKSPDEETSDLCVRAFEDLRLRNSPGTDAVDCVVVCTQNPDGKGLPQTSAHVHRKLGLGDNVAAFDISLGCSGYIYGLNVMVSFMNAQGLKNGLFFTADPYSKILDPADRNTELLFGDAATCSWIGEQPEYVVLRSCFATDGTGWDAIAVNSGTSRLVMRGKDVFMFTMKKVPAQIEQCLRINSLTKDDIGLYILHQGSKYIVENLARQLQVDPGKVPFRAGGVGNTVSSSIPLVLKETIGLGNDCILLSGFGVGLSWATTVLKKYTDGD